MPGRVRDPQDSQPPDWKQHFPTYSFRQRDVVLAEFDAALRSLDAEERIFVNASNLVLVVGAGLGSLAIGSLSTLVTTYRHMIPPAATLVLAVALALVLSLVATRYFATRQKAIVFAARKVIVLRRMLGLSYGNLQLVLPNWRVEGADEPFAIHMFPGWRSYAAYPFWLMSTFSAGVLFFVLTALMEELSCQAWLTSLRPWVVAATCSLGWLVILAAVFRRALYDTHERPLLSAARTVARVLNLQLVGNIEHVLYRAELARYEVKRMRLDTGDLKRLAVFIVGSEKDAPCFPEILTPWWGLRVDS